MELAQGFYSQKKIFQNSTRAVSEALSKLEKSQQEAESLLKKMEAEDRAENLEKDKVQSLIQC